MPGKYGAGFHLDLPEVLSPKVGGLGCVVLAARSPRALEVERKRYVVTTEFFLSRLQH